MSKHKPEYAGREGPAKGRPGSSNRPRVLILGLGQMGLVCAGALVTGSGGGAAGGARPAGAAPGETSGVGGLGGGGAGGSAGALRNPASVMMWGHSPDEAGVLTQTRQSERLPGYRLHESVRVTSKVPDACEFGVDRLDLIVSAIPVQHMREVWARFRGLLAPTVGVVSVAKGIENGTLLRPTQVVADVLRDDPDKAPRPLGVLSGPTIAAELARCLPATMIAASDDPSFAALLQRLFSTSWLRIYTQEDVIGVELAGAVKNVIAIAAGVLDGLQAGNNAKSALLARGLAEISRLGAAMGASPATFFGLAGVGDLATSCFSPEGRNRSCGEALGRGESLDSYLRRCKSVVEGVPTARSVMELARKFKVEMPITEVVHAVLYEGLDPLDGIGRLMSRELKQERVG